MYTVFVLWLGIWLRLFSTNYCISVASMALIRPACGAYQWVSPAQLSGQQPSPSLWPDVFSELCESNSFSLIDKTLTILNFFFYSNILRYWIYTVVSYCSYSLIFLLWLHRSCVGSVQFTAPAVCSTTTDQGFWTEEASINALEPTQHQTLSKQG